jgi:hypothetical protein
MTKVSILIIVSILNETGVPVYLKCLFVLVAKVVTFRDTAERLTDIHGFLLGDVPKPLVNDIRA